MTIYLLPWKVGKSARNIKEKINIIIKKPNTPLKGKVLINWGNSHAPQFKISQKVKVYNQFNLVAIAANKLETFKKLAGKVNIPEFTTNIEEAKKWKGKILCRQLTGSGGKDIVVCDKTNLQDAPLYVKYIPKVAEYRVHVWDDVIDYARKKKKNGGVENKLIRNHDNGWIFCKENVVLPDNVKELAIKAVNEIGLDFGAVDIIVDKKGVPYVLEINTAPGLEGRTVDSYATKISTLRG